MSGSACSMCGSIARQLIVQPHFLHFTTQAEGSPKFRPVISAIIGEQKEKVISHEHTPVVDFSARVSRDGFRASDKLKLRVRPLPPVGEATLYSRPPWSRRRSSLDLWLDPGITDSKRVVDYLKPLDSTLMKKYPVSTRVNRPENDDQECAREITIAAPAPRLF